MRKIYFYNLVSLDGFFAGPGGEIDWHRVNDEFNRYAIDLLNSVDTIIFGRITYQLFESFWPAAAKDPATAPDDRLIANLIDDAHKLVFSKTLQSVTWKNARLFREVDPGEITSLKAQPGKDMVIYGSANLAQSFIRYGLVDGYRIFVNPVILGSGMPLFPGLDGRINLKLADTIRFQTGVVLLDYQPEQEVSTK